MAIGSPFKSVMFVVALVAACVSMAGLASAQAPSGVQLTTIPPPGEYETLGVVLAIARVTPGGMGKDKPFREAFKTIMPELETQAKALAANMCVITNISLVPGGEGYIWVVVHGTAIKTGSAGR